MSLAKQPCEKCYMIFEVQRNEPNTFGERYQASFVFCPLHQAVPELVKAIKQTLAIVSSAGERPAYEVVSAMVEILQQALATVEGR
mgnify:CR=1